MRDVFFGSIGIGSAIILSLLLSISTLRPDYFE
jgi:hypothetical protein